MILLNVHPDISRGRDDVLALMFDMNDLWVLYAALQIRGHLRDRLTVAAQKSNVSWYVSKSMVICNQPCVPSCFFENYAILSTILVQTTF